MRITHLPSGIVVSMQNEKSQLQNKEAALRVLASRLAAEARAKKEAEASAQRLSQVRTVDRSERIRTYNFPENRIADHRTGFKAHNLDAVLSGALDAVISSLQEADEAERPGRRRERMSAQVEGQWGLHEPGRGCAHAWTRPGLTRSTPTCASSSSGRATSPRSGIYPPSSTPNRRRSCAAA